MQSDSVQSELLSYSLSASVKFIVRRPASSASSTRSPNVCRHRRIAKGRFAWIASVVELCCTRRSHTHLPFDDREFVQIKNKTISAWLRIWSWCEFKVSIKLKWALIVLLIATLSIAVSVQTVRLNFECFALKPMSPMSPMSSTYANSLSQQCNSVSFEVHACASDNPVVGQQRPVGRRPKPLSVYSSGLKCLPFRAWICAHLSGLSQWLKPAFSRPTCGFSSSCSSSSNRSYLFRSFITLHRNVFFRLELFNGVPSSSSHPRALIYQFSTQFPQQPSTY